MFKGTFVSDVLGIFLAPSSCSEVPEAMISIAVNGVKFPPQ